MAASQNKTAAKQNKMAAKQTAESIPDNIRNQWLIIGISGVTCGGKTTLANRLKNSLYPVYVFNQDKYFYLDDSPKHVKVEGIDHNNYDILSSLDMEQMYKDIISTMHGQNKAQSKSLERKDASLELANKKFLILEGFTALNYKPICDLCDLRYYFVLEYSECFARRVLRAYDPPDVDGYFEKCVWPEHCRYRDKIEQDPRVRILDGTDPRVFDRLLSDLKAAGVVEVHL